MASDQNTGAEVILYAESPAGTRTILFKGVNEQTGPGGSPDGAQATVKANELPRMPPGKVLLTGGVKIIPAVKLKVADGVDASDCVFNIPVTDVNGHLKYLSTADLGISTDLPASTPASQISDLGTGYELSNGEKLVLGGVDGSQGATYFMSVENDTA